MDSKKFRIKQGMKIVAVNAPASYLRQLQHIKEVPEIKTALTGKQEMIHLFVRTKKELEKHYVKTAKALAPGGYLWIFYPKASSAFFTDFSRDKGWEELEKFPLRWLSLVSLDNDWTAFLLKYESVPKASKASAEYHKNSASVTDAKTKTVIVPDDLMQLLNKKKTVTDFFNSLSYTNRKEYVMWLVSAKREETRHTRLRSIIEKLSAGKKNPAEK